MERKVTLTGTVTLSKRDIWLLGHRLSMLGKLAEA